MLTHELWTLAKLIIVNRDSAKAKSWETGPRLETVSQELINCIQNPWWDDDRCHKSTDVVLQLRLKIPKNIRIFWPRKDAKRVRFQKEQIFFCPNEVRYLMPETTSMPSLEQTSSLMNSMEAEEIVSARHRSSYRIYSPSLTDGTFDLDTDPGLFPLWSSFGRSIGFGVSPNVSLESIRLTLTLAPDSDTYRAQVGCTDWNQTLCGPDPFTM
jgi:hypothetical protein